MTGNTHAAVATAISFILKDYVLIFVIGYLSHLVIDLLNNKGEQLFYPLPNRYCVELVPVSGKVNDVLFCGFSVVAAGLLLINVI